MVTPQDPPGRQTPRWLAAATAALTLFAGTLPSAGVPAAHADDGTAGEGETLTIASSQPVDSLSPFLAQFLISTSIHRLAYDYLTNYSPENNEPIPGLAESWETSDDGLTWTFTIRDGVEWSDGEPLTAEDVAWTYSTMMSDDGAATANGNFVENFTEVTAPDERTVRIELEQPQSTMLALDIPIVPKHVWKDVDDYAQFNNDDDFPIVGSGPFQITDYQPNQSVTLEANEDYWRDPPNFDRLVFRYYSDKDAEIEALRKGEVSFASGLTPAQADSLRDEENITVNNAAGKRFQAFTINPGARTKDGTEFGDGHPALQDKTVRQAIMRAIDREEIVDKAHGGYAEAAGGYIPSRYDKYSWQPEEQRLGFDPQAAEEMLEEAGYEKGSDGVRVSPDGERMELRLHAHNDQPANINAAKIMAERLGDIGIEVDNRAVDPGVLSDALHEGEYDLIFTGWSVNPDPDFVLGIHTCDALPETPGTMRGDAYFCDEEYDELYEKQLREYEDEEQRAEYVADMQRILYDEAVVNTLAYPDAIEAYRSDQIGSIQVQPEPDGNIWGQDGHWSWTSATPADDESRSGISTAAAAGIAAVVVLVVAGAAVVIWRRRAATVEDRE
ncbi:peptide/nickel transport system substrate-binding protein [Haloactinospora alba]|uniref:Peptide/nickel transport system substrate-binding protein n=1 Tax=Haloactinospora alba TaxID=405555 RepID=A0A543NJX8_9ACTN|nr:ABC transporter substrate-binding protein [Haloactinospora alba]TQN32112.1 peptide/nickel transport system substrate-binding protein [Haloactinospora alba]